MAADKVVDDLFRQEYGKILATLTRFFGSSYFELAEDVVQDTLITAIEHWGEKGVPNNPTAWLIQVAKRKALNEIKRDKVARKFEASVDSVSMHETPDSVFLESEIADNLLRMIFTCCHPSLDIKSQLALTLKTLCGFSVPEVARALLSNEPAINKRLYRAKEKFRQDSIEFAVPTGSSLEQRMDAVLLCLYLLYNEGYNSSSHDELIRKELCLEAMRLTHIVVMHMESDGRANALLSLMCFHTARFDSRIDNKGGIILFKDQDRSDWNKELIEQGMHWFNTSFGGSKLSTYHIEARIAAEHCTSISFEETNWGLLESQYELLLELKPSPIISLNLAIIKSQTSGWKNALAMLHALEEDKDISDYHLLSATIGMGYLEQNDREEALRYFTKSLKQNPPMKERAFIEGKIKFCENRGD